MRGPEFAELTAFVAVAEQRNFTRAAANLGIAPSTLSQTIRALEERLGIRLLNRTTRSVATTEAGERLLAELQPALDGIGKAMETVNAYRDTPMGTLRLCVSRPASLHIIAPLLIRRSRSRSPPMTRAMTSSREDSMPACGSAS
jgi:DNA-binding transcriptional LysR family regulator